MTTTTPTPRTRTLIAATLDGGTYLAGCVDLETARHDRAEYGWELGDTWASMGIAGDELRVVVLERVPEELAKRLCAQGEPAQFFSDGYEAYAHALPYARPATDLAALMEA